MFRTKATNMVTYEKFLNETCKIPFQWYVNPETKQLKWRDLTGPEKLRLFSTIHIPQLFPSLPHAVTVQEIWSSFFALYQELTKAPKNEVTVVEVEEFQANARAWVQKFLTVYQAKNITPYVHALANHVSEFLQLYGSLVPYNQQGLEKLNDFTTKDYQRSSNHRDVEALKQILEKKNRIEYLEDHMYVRKKRTVHCSICKKPGHNCKGCKNGQV